MKAELPFPGRAAKCEHRVAVRPHIKQRREEAHNKIKIPGFKARNRVVERTLSWINRFRKLLDSLEKTGASYVALLLLACAMIRWRQPVTICG
jgi:hypothetical protein